MGSLLYWLLSSLLIADSSATYQSAVYFVNWSIYGRDFHPQNLVANHTSRVLYAFADLQSDGTVLSSDEYADLQKHYPTDSWNEMGKNAYGCIKQLFLLKKEHRGMKVLLSIGGWSYSQNFAIVAASSTARTIFATTAVALVTDWGFDGVDVDWEYPADRDQASNFVLLLQALRQALDAYAAMSASGYHFLITVACPAGPTNYELLQLAAMEPYVDSWNLMAYDFVGSWDVVSGHQANLFPSQISPMATPYSIDKAVRDYIAGGISPSKLILGMPLYGRSFETTAGPGRFFSGVGSGDWEAGVWDYKTLPKIGASEIFDDVVGAAYSYDTITKELITYDTIESAIAKADYIVNEALGGGIWWEASGDGSGPDSLIKTVVSVLGSIESSENWLSYPKSQYSNIAAGVP